MGAAVVAVAWGLTGSLIAVPPAHAADDLYESAGFVGQDPFVQGALNAPSSVAVDSAGNVYVADNDQYSAVPHNRYIQKFTSDGEFITEWGTAGSDDGQFYASIGAWGIAVDGADNVYALDSGNSRVQKFTSDGTFIRKWGGYGSQDGRFVSADGIAVDSAGDVYVTDDNRVQRFTTDGAFVLKWTSPGADAVAVDTAGFVYTMPSSGSLGIKKYTDLGALVGTLGSGSTLGAADGQFDNPRGMTVDESGNIYVADTFNHRVQKFSSTGQFLTKWGSNGVRSGQFDRPSAITTDADGNLFVTEYGNNRVQKFTSTGAFDAKWGSSSSSDGGFDRPGDVAVDGTGDVYVADTYNDRVQKFTGAGEFVTMWGTAGASDGEFDAPGGVATDGDGNVYVADSGNDRVQKFTSTGEFVTTWGTSGSGNGQFDSPGGIAVDGSGIVYVTDTGNDRVQKFTSAGDFITTWGSYGSTDSQFRSIGDIAVDGFGYVYVTDTERNRVQKFTSNGAYVLKWGSYGTDDGQFSSPYASGRLSPGDIAVDGAGDVYVADSGADRLQKFTSTGQFTTKWGSHGTSTGQFDYPEGIAVGGAGNVYVTDSRNHRVQRFLAVDGSSPALASPTFTSATGTTDGFSVTIANLDPSATYSVSATAGTAALSGSTITVTGLNSDEPSTVTVTASEEGFSASQGQVTGRSLAGPPLPAATFATASSAPGGFSVALTNFDGSLDYSVSSTAGSVSLSGTLITVTGLTAGQSATVTVTASRSGFASSHSQVTGQALPQPAMPEVADPTFAVPTSTVGGFSVVLTNFDVSVSYGVSTTAGAVSRSGSTIIVTALAAGQSATVTVTASDDGRTPGEGQITGTALAQQPAPPLPGPTFASPVSTVDGFSTTITNFDVSATYSASTTAGILSRSGSSILVSGLAASQSATVTVTAARNGFAPSQGQVTGQSLAPQLMPPTAPVVTAAEPTIDGRPKVGVSLAVFAGAWTPGCELSYRWLSGGVAIPGATGATYTPQPRDVKTTLTVEVTGTMPGYVSAVSVSKASAPVAKGTLKAARPRVVGAAKVGKKLTAKTGNWTTGAKLSYRWLRNGKRISAHASRSTYVPVAADAGAKLTVRVTAVLAGYSSSVVTSKSTAKIKR